MPEVDWNHRGNAYEEFVRFISEATKALNAHPSIALVHPKTYQAMGGDINDLGPRPSGRVAVLLERGKPSVWHEWEQ